MGLWRTRRGGVTEGALRQLYIRFFDHAQNDLRAKKACGQANFYPTARLIYSLLSHPDFNRDAGCPILCVSKGWGTDYGYTLGDLISSEMERTFQTVGYK